MKKCKILSVFCKTMATKTKKFRLFDKNNKHYLFLTERFTRYFNILEHFLSNLRSEKIMRLKNC